MKIDFLDTYQIWDLKKLEIIRNTVFEDLLPCQNLLLDVRGCAFDYLSAPSIVSLALEHLDKHTDAAALRKLTIVFEEMTSSEVCSEFFGTLVGETPETEDLDSLIDAWAKSRNVHIEVVKHRSDATTDQIAEYGKPE